MKSIFRLTAVAAFLLLGAVAHAELITITVQFEGNECNKDDGPFSGKDCIIVDNEGNEISPYLGKYEGDGKGWVDVDTVFDTSLITFYEDEAYGVEETDDQDIFDRKVGGWTYDGDANLIRFWTAKAGKGFILYFYSEDSSCSVNWNDPDCLANAQAVTAGSWDTGLLESDLSHISFFNGGGDITVPEPGTLALLGLGLVGIGVARRRRVA